MKKSFFSPLLELAQMTHEHNRHYLRLLFTPRSLPLSRRADISLEDGTVIIYTDFAEQGYEGSDENTEGVPPVDPNEPGVQAREIPCRNQSDALDVVGRHMLRLGPAYYYAGLAEDRPVLVHEQDPNERIVAHISKDHDSLGKVTEFYPYQTERDKEVAFNIFGVRRKLTYDGGGSPLNVLDDPEEARKLSS